MIILDLLNASEEALALIIEREHKSLRFDYTVTDELVITGNANEINAIRLAYNI